MSKLDTNYTPIWNYTFSGVNWILESKKSKVVSFGDEYMCTNAGINSTLLISLASVVEGFLRAFIRKKVVKFDELGSHVSKATNEEIAVSPEDLKRLTEEYKGSSRLIKYLGLKTACRNVRRVNCLKTFSLYLFGCMKFGTSKAKLILAINSIERATWNDLEGYFNKFSSQKLSRLMKNENINYEGLKMLFTYRNFLTHGGLLIHDDNSKNVQTIEKGETLLNYLNKMGIAQKDKFYINNILPDEVISHFHRIANDFVNSTVFENDLDIRNTLVQIF